MAIAYVNSWVGTVSNGGDLTISLSGVTEGNLLVAFCTKDDGAQGIAVTGFTELYDTNRGGGLFRAWAGYKIAGASETSVVFDGDTEAYAGIVLEFSGVDETTPLDQSQEDQDFVGPHTVASFTPNNNNSLIVSSIGWDLGSDRGFNMDTDLTLPEAAQNSGAGGAHVGIRVGYEIQTTAQAQDYSHSETAGNTSTVMHTLVFDEAAVTNTTIEVPVGPVW